jgi:hypothetical protein
MALRDLRGARLRRAFVRRPVALAVALYLAAGALALGPDLRHIRSDFLGYGSPPTAGVAPGDHLQSAYNLWLPGHQLVRGHAPWVDPYSFQPEADERTNFAGWPFAAAFGPLKALFGTVTGWNVFVLLTYIGAGGFAALWLRSLGLPIGAALAGGLAFALAPYRSVQTAGGHLLGPVAMLLPLALWGLERRRVWLAALALASIPLSGQVHLALGALVFVLAYAAVRRRAVPGLVSVGLASIAGLVVYLVGIRGTVGAGGRSFAQVERYSAEPADLVVRHARHGFETFVFLGWLLPVAAIVGAALLWRRDRGLLAVLGLGALVPVVFALGANTPLYEPVWRVVPGLENTRVAARLLPIACLALAALSAVALSRLRWRWAALVALPLVALDLRVSAYQPLGSDEHNRVYERLAEAPPGRILDEPVYLPDRQEGSVYLYYAMQAPRERPAGYSTTAAREADATLRRIRGLLCSTRPGLNELLAELGVRYVVLHSGRPGCLGDRFGDRPPLASTDRIVAYELPSS